MLNTHKHHSLEAQTAVLLTADSVSNKIQTYNNSTSDKQQNAQEIVAALAELLAQVQGQTANLQGERGVLNSQLSSEVSKGLNEQAQDIFNQVQQAIAAEHESFWDKLINGLMAFVGAILTPFFPEIGIPMMAIAVCNLTGLTDKITNCIADVLEKMGVSKDVANMISQIAIFAAVTLVSMGSSIGSDTTAIAAIVKTAGSIGMGLTMAPQMFTDIAVVVLNNSSMSDADKKALENKLALIQAILGAILMISSAGTQFFSSVAREVGESGTLAERAFARLKASCPKVAGLLEKFMGPQAQAAFNFSTATANCTKSFQNMANGFKVAKIEEALAQSEAGLGVMQFELKAMNSMNSSDMQSFSQRIQSQSKMMADIVGFVETEGQSYVQASANF